MLRLILSSLRLMRLHHWVKNSLVLIPLVTSFSLADQNRVQLSLWAFLAFSLIASATYIANDLIDLPHDRQHIKKRLRPLAAGDVSVMVAVLWALVLMTAGGVIAYQVSQAFLASLVSYIVLTLVYSRFLKTQPLLDVMALVALWNLRLLAGALAIGVGLSVWLLSFGAFLFLSLSLLKRATELRATTQAPQETLPGRGYCKEDLQWLEPLGLAAAVAATVVLALFVDSSGAQWRYPHPERLWLLCPAIFYWQLRLWFKMHRGVMHHDPVSFSLKDRASWWVALWVVLSVVWAHGGS